MTIFDLELAGPAAARLEGDGDAQGKAIRFALRERPPASVAEAQTQTNRAGTREVGPVRFSPLPVAVTVPEALAVNCSTAVPEPWALSLPSLSELAAGAGGPAWAVSPAAWSGRSRRMRGRRNEVGVDGGGRVQRDRAGAGPRAGARPAREGGARVRGGGQQDVVPLLSSALQDPGQAIPAGCRW